MSEILQEDRENSVTIGVADEHIGIVVGRGGRNIIEISQVPDKAGFLFWFLTCTISNNQSGT